MLRCLLVLAWFAPRIAHADPVRSDLPLARLSGSPCDTARGGMVRCGIIAKARVRGVGEVAVWGDRRFRTEIETTPIAIVRDDVWTGWLEVGDDSGCNTHACPEIRRIKPHLRARTVRGARGFVVDLELRIGISDDPTVPPRPDTVTARFLFACTDDACRETAWVPAVVAGQASCAVALDRRIATATWSCPKETSLDPD